MPDKYATTLAELEEAVTASKGYIAHSEIGAIDLIFKIFMANSRYVLVTIRHMDEPENVLTIFKTESKTLPAFNIALSQGFFIFVSSSSALIDHSRRFVEKMYEKSDVFQTDYKKKVNDDFINNPLAKFVKDFRNYIVHRNIPNNTFNLNFPELKSSVFFNTKELLEWDNWTKYSKEYIANNSEIYLEKVAIIGSYSYLC